MPFQLPAEIVTETLIGDGVTIYYPQVKRLANEEAEEQINRRIVSQVIGMIQEQGKYQVSRDTEMVGHYEIKTNERGILSLTQSNYAYSYPMAHGFTLLSSLTADIGTGKVYQLSDLFTPGSDYVQVLSRIVAEQIQQREIPLVNPFQSISPNQDYYLADKSLVLYFQLYELAPYVYGFPMFPISVYDLQSLYSDESPLSRLAADIA